MGLLTDQLREYLVYGYRGSVLGIDCAGQDYLNRRRSADSTLDTLPLTQAAIRRRVEREARSFVRSMMCVWGRKETWGAVIVNCAVPA